MNAIQPVIVGAGPAGIRAAQALVQAGLKPIVLDESFHPGGQIYRQPPPGFTRPKSQLYGTEHHKADSLHRQMQAMESSIDYRPQSLVWNAQGHALDVIQAGRSTRVEFSHLILATGATDRVLPFEGWTTPGVYTLGASQIALKFQGTVIGSRVTFLGTGPLLYLVAYQYVKAGANVVAVLDTGSLAARAGALAGMLRTPALLAKGLVFMAYLCAKGIPMLSNVRPVRVQGQERVRGLVCRSADGGRERTFDCDGIGYGLGLRSETQLASLLGCEYRFHARDRAWLPQRDEAGRSSLPQVYLAGDGAGIMGADAAERAGERAALALLADAGMAIDQNRAQQLEHQLQHIDRSRTVLERAFPFPADMVPSVADEVVLCRCEEVTVGTVRRAIADGSIAEMNRLKALTRVGMGRCQGRMCAAATAELLASARNVPLADVGRIRTQPPVKPIPIMACPPPAACEKAGT